MRIPSWEIRAEDARVHCVVLKIRTEPCIANLHPEVRDDRPFEVEALSEAAASSGPNSVLTQTEIPCARSAVPQAGCLLAAPFCADLSE